MRNEQGFSLIELLIVVAIIAIIAAIAVPSLMTSRMAANEASAIQGCRTIGSAEIAYASTSNQQYDSIANLILNKFLDARFTNGIDGYTYANANVTIAEGSGGEFTNDGANFAVVATPATNMGRFLYGIGTDQIVRYMGATTGYTDPTGLVEGTGMGAMAASGGGGSRP